MVPPQPLAQRTDLGPGLSVGDPRHQPRHDLIVPCVAVLGLQVVVGQRTVQVRLEGELEALRQDPVDRVKRRRVQGGLLPQHLDAPSVAALPQVVAQHDAVVLLGVSLLGPARPSRQRDAQHLEELMAAENGRSLLGHSIAAHVVLCIRRVGGNPFEEAFVLAQVGQLAQ